MLSGATPGRPSSSNPNNRLKKCKSLTWDACTWNTDLVTLGGLNFCPQKSWGRLTPKNKQNDPSLSFVEASPAWMKTTRLSGALADENDSAESNKDTSKTTSTPGKISSLPRRATFCNFPKDLSGDVIRGGEDHMRLRREAGIEEVPPEITKSSYYAISDSDDSDDGNETGGGTTSEETHQARDFTTKSARRLRRVDSAELVRKAFPGMLFGLQPDKARSDSVESDDIFSESEVYSENEFELETGRTTPEEDRLPAPPPLNSVVPPLPCPVTPPPGLAPPYFPQHPSYGGIPMMPMVPPIPQPPPGMPAGSPQQYMQAMHNHLLYCIQMQQLMFAQQAQVLGAAAAAATAPQLSSPPYVATTTQDLMYQHPPVVHPMDVPRQQANLQTQPSPTIATQEPPTSAEHNHHVPTKNNALDEDDATVECSRGDSDSVASVHDQENYALGSNVPDENRTDGVNQFDISGGTGMNKKEKTKPRTRKKKGGASKDDKPSEKLQQLQPHPNYASALMGNLRRDSISSNSTKESVGSSSEKDMSQLLSEHKSTGRKPSLKELAGHVMEFSRDSSGSRYIQNAMGVATPSERHAVIEEIIDDCVLLMEDLFGNYVMQNLLEHSTEEQRTTIANKMRGIVLHLSTQAHGCRVVQRILDLAQPELRNDLLSEIISDENTIAQCARDTHATHVLQKAVVVLQRDVMPHLERRKKRGERFYNNKKRSSTSTRGPPNASEERNEPETYAPRDTSYKAISTNLLEAIEIAVSSEVMVLAVHPNACRLVQRVLADCDKTRSPRIKHMVESIEKQYPALCIDQHGNFILQHILDSGQDDQANAIQEYVSTRAVKLSQHKFGSHLVEKCLTTATPEQATIIIHSLLDAANHIAMESSPLIENERQHTPLSAAPQHDEPQRDRSVLLQMMKDPYANFVLQRAFDVSEGELRERLSKEIEKRADLISQYTYGRHIITHVSKQSHPPPSSA